MASFQAIIPKNKLLKAQLSTVLREAADDVSKQVERDLKAITRTWKHKVRFRKRFVSQRGNLVYTVSTGDRIFGYVNDGTPPHIIRPKKPGGVLAFQKGYRAKTTPRVLASRTGGKYGPMVYRFQVRHPGTDAREFTKVIAEKHEVTLAKALRAAIRRAKG